MRSDRKHSVASVGTISWISSLAASRSVRASRRTAWVTAIDSSSGAVRMVRITSCGVHMPSRTGSVSPQRLTALRAAAPVEITAHSIASAVSNSLHVMLVMGRR